MVAGGRKLVLSGSKSRTRLTVSMGTETASQQLQKPNSVREAVLRSWENEKSPHEDVVQPSFAFRILMP